MSRVVTLLPALLILFLAGCQVQPIQRAGNLAGQTALASSTPSSKVDNVSTSFPATELPYPPPKPTYTEAPYQPPVVSSPRPTSTPPNYTQTPTHIPPNYTRTPTFAAVLMQPLPFTLPAGLPEGSAVQVFEVGRPITPGEFNQNTVQAILKEKSYFYKHELAHPRTESAAAVNQALAPFGYRLVPSPEQQDSFSLYQGDKLLLDKVAMVSRVSVNRSQTDFVLFVENWPRGFFMVRRNGLEELPHTGTGYGEQKYDLDGWPKFIGDDWMYPREELDREPGLSHVKVYRDD